jgi:hypothetical protein
MTLFGLPGNLGLPFPHGLPTRDLMGFNVTFNSFDMRLSRASLILASVSTAAIGEVFNLFNQTNILDAEPLGLFQCADSRQDKSQFVLGFRSLPSARREACLAPGDRGPSNWRQN